MQGAFVRALGTVYHLQCFKCVVRTISFLICALHELLTGLRGCRRLQILPYRWP